MIHICRNCRSLPFLPCTHATYFSSFLSLKLFQATLLLFYTIVAYCHLWNSFLDGNGNFIAGCPCSCASIALLPYLNAFLVYFYFVILRPLYSYMIRWAHLPRSVSAIIAIFLSVLLILVPLYYLISTIIL
jgi:hypothetical protein